VLSSVQFVFPPPSKVATSLEVGAVVLLAPPLVVDQLLFEVKFPSAGPIQYLVAAWEEKDSARERIRVKINIANLLYGKQGERSDKFFIITLFFRVYAS
jgi:hypothetical protein